MVEVSKTFSELWYRVADFKPRLSSHLNVRRHTYRNEIWFVLGDPASSKYYRFNAGAFRFLGLLDGKRKVQEAWDVCNAQLGDDSPTQKDCIDLLCQLQMFGLMRGELPIDAQRLRERIDQIKERKFQERTGKFVFWTIPLINPERFLAKYANVGRFVFSGFGLIILLILLVLALRAVIPHGDEFASSFNWIIAPQNLVWLTICFLSLKVIHEFAHGFACKAYGGRVTEMGLFFMIVLPIPYCDATASWGFPNKWHRIMVSSAGMLVELAVACIAGMIWANTSPGMLIHTLCYNVMMIASVSTIVFNLNPLLRYDGYYILADLLEIPNLSSRSHELLKWMTRRYLFGLKGEPCPPLREFSEGLWMVIHAICAFPYRLLVMLTIVLIVMDKYFIVGMILAILGAIVWFGVPVVKGLSYVVSEPTLEAVRLRAITTTFGVIIVIIAFIGFVPVPSRVYAAGVVEPDLRQTFRVPYSGYLQDVRFADGDLVHKDQVVIRLYNPELEQQYITSKSRLHMGQLQMDSALANSPASYEMAGTILDNAEKYYEISRNMLNEMTLTAPFTGTFISPELNVKIGTYIKNGTAIGILATLDKPVIRAYLDDADNRWLVHNENKLKRIDARFYGHSDENAELQIIKQMPAGQRSISYPSLGTSTEGGVVATDPTDPQGQKTVSPQWEITLSIISDSRDKPINNNMDDTVGRDNENSNNTTISNTEGNIINLLPGTRANIRFTLDSEPLSIQWYRWLQQAFRRRFGA